MFIFFLGREYLLSIAEILSTFPTAQIVEYDRAYAVLQGIDRDDIVARYPSMGGTIKVVEVIGTYRTDSEEPELIARYLTETIPDGKIRYALSYTDSKRTVDHIGVGIRTKERIKALGRSARLVNKDRKNINSAVYRIEKLGGPTGREVCMVGGRLDRYIGATIAYQDVDAYSDRDMSKQRDMVVGMLPPKLAQMMLHLAGTTAKTVYDPFVGLGTVLIEAIHAGYQSVLGSDLSLDMVEAASLSVSKYIDEGETRARYDIWYMDATRIKDDLSTRKPLLTNDTAIVTEGYLGRIFTPRSIAVPAVLAQRAELIAMYDRFFAGLKALGYRGTVVVTLPVWTIGEKNIRMEGMEDILARHGYRARHLLPESIRRELGWTHPTILYRRPGQTVGREVWAIEAK